MGTSMMTQLFGEFFGTMILVLLGDGVCAAVNLKKSKAFASGWVVIALGWGAAVTLAVYMSGYMSPAHLNPAESGTLRADYGLSVTKNLIHASDSVQSAKIEMQRFFG